MAQHVNVSFVDDLDGGEAAGTVSFGLDGTTYEIDLSEQNLEKLRAVFAPYVDAGRRSGGPARRASARPSDRGENQAIREWAQAQGLSVSRRGRLSAEVRQAYGARNAASTPVAPVDAAPVDAAPVERPRRTSTVQQPMFSGVQAEA